MVASKRFTLLTYFTAVAFFLGARAAPCGGEDASTCKLTINGHSIRTLTLIEKSGRSGIRLDKPGETVELPAGEYRIEQVELEGGYSLAPLATLRQRQEWFRVTPEGPNELVVGAPLYPAVTARRHGGFIEMDYDTIDAAGRSYQKSLQDLARRPSPPTFTVYKDGDEIGSGSFEYG